MESIKNFTKKIRRSPMLSFFLIVALIIGPNAALLPSMSFRAAIATAIGIDKLEDGIHVSCLVISQVNKEDMKENTKMVTGKGKTLSHALTDIEIGIGRKTELGHIQFIVISEELAQNDIAPILDKLLRSSQLANSIPIIISKYSAKEVLAASNQLLKTSALRLSEIISTNYSEGYIRESSIESFFKGYHSQVNCSTLNYIELTSNKNNGVSSDVVSPGMMEIGNTSSGIEGASGGGGEDSGGGGQQSSGGGEEQSSGGGSEEQEPKDVIDLKKECVLLKEGKIQDILSREVMNGIDWIEPKKERSFLSVTNFSNEQFKDARLSFEIMNKFVTTETYFLNNKPHIRYILNMNLNIDEVVEEHGTSVANMKVQLTPKLSNVLDNKIKGEFMVALKKLREEKTDILGVYQKFFIKHNKEFKKFLNDLKDATDFLKFIQFEMVCNFELL